jgi:hypothetical protein
MKRGSVIGNILWTVVFTSISVLGLTACGGDSGPTPGALAITTTSLPEGIINRPYSASVSGSGGALPYTWSVSPALPANLSLDPATGAITGTPTTQGTTTHAFTVRDTSAPSQTVEQTLSLTIDPPLAITTTSLPAASISSSYNQAVETVGGIGALTFSIVPGTGTLPQNFSLNPTTGIISGSPIAPAGNFPFTVRVADEGGQEDTQALSVSVTPTTPPQITSGSLPNGTVGLPYSERVQATGGIGELAWSVSAGLPPGLSLGPSGANGGTISGTPTSGGPFNFTVTITDSVGQTDTQALSINVTPFSITTTSLPSGSIGQAYSEQVNTIGGTTPLTFSIVPPGTLPPGLNLHPSTGLISGTPLLPAATSSFTVRVADAGGREATRALSITINLFNAPNITTTALQGGTVGQSYNETLQANGGIGALTWSVSAGSLPAGLVFDPAGSISGVPTIAGTSNFTVTVTDTFNQSDTQDLTIAVDALEITTTSLPAATENQRYTATLLSSGGIQPVSWSVSPPLPDTLSLNPLTGEISGIPAGTTQGTHSLTFTAQDSASPTPQIATRQLDLTIAPP